MKKSLQLCMQYDTQLTYVAQNRMQQHQN